MIRRPTGLILRVEMQNRLIQMPALASMSRLKPRSQQLKSPTGIFTQPKE